MSQLESLKAPWLEIFSAPKDGSMVTVCYHGWAPYTVYWRPIYGWTPIEFDAPVNPTHWKPRRETK